MALDPNMASLIQAQARQGLPPLSEQPLDAARRSFGKGCDPTPPVPVDAVDQVIAGPGGPLSVRLYKPKAPGPLPLLVYLHGGGWVLGDLDTSDVPCRLLAHRAGCTVLSVGYRLAPEHPYPAALEDTLFAATWAAHQGRSIGTDGRLAVGGESAGANVAAAAALVARDRGGPPFSFQLLVYPATCFSCDTPSQRDMGEGFGLGREDMIWFWSQYLARPEDGRAPYASPLLAKDLSSLPPALILTAEYDPLRDEGEAYGERLRQAGVDALVCRYDGMAHGFFRRPAVLAHAGAAIDLASAELKRAFSATRAGD